MENCRSKTFRLSITVMRIWGLNVLKCDNITMGSIFVDINRLHFLYAEYDFFFYFDFMGEM